MNIGFLIIKYISASNMANEWFCVVIRQCIWPQEGPPLPRIKHGKVIIILLTTVISYCIQKSFSYFGEYHFLKKNLCSKTWCFLKLSVYTNVLKCQKKCNRLYLICYQNVLVRLQSNSCYYTQNTQFEGFQFAGHDRGAIFDFKSPCCLEP